MKKPVIKGWQSVGLRGSAKLAENFPHAEMLGFCPGKRSGVTVLDIDTTDERVLADALSHHGETPLKVRTASGKFHLYYRHDREKRRIRPWDDWPIDLLGSGLVIAPPSVAPSRDRYKIIEGKLEDILHLPVIRGVHELKEANKIEARAKNGARGDTLFKFCLRASKKANSAEELYAMASAENVTYLPPLEEGLVQKAVSSAWRYEIEGKNWVGRGGMVGLAFDEVDGLACKYPDAFALLAFLRRHNSGRTDFFLANATASPFGWGRNRFKKARKQLEGVGAIRCLQSGGRGKNDPPIYSWG